MTDPALPGFLDRGGELGVLMRSHPWEDTPLGPIEGWPQSLRTAVSMCLNTDFAMLVVWGPEYTQFYNDSYAEILGGKHPAALGASAGVVWAEIWEQIRPWMDQVLTTGETVLEHDQVLYVSRRGYEEEMFCTFCYSPIVQEDGTIGGLLNVVTETTGPVLARRRLAAVSRLASERPDWRGVAADVLGVLVQEGGDITSALLTRGEEQVVAIGPLQEAGVELAAPAAGARPVPAVRTTLAVPALEEPLELTLGLSRLLPYDSWYQEFCVLAARAVGEAIDRAAAAEQQRLRAEQEVRRLREDAARLEELLAREHQIAETLQRSLLPTVMATAPWVELAARYEPAQDAPALGGDWYDAMTLEDGTLVLTVGDVVGHGLEAAATMGHLRSATRALAHLVDGPAALLAQLNALALHDGDIMATCLTAFVEAPGRRLRIASAGHPPAVARAPSAPSSALAVEPGLPLGAMPGAIYEEVAFELAAGSVLAIHTDGVVERRGERITTGLERLRGILDAATGGPADMLEQLMAGARPAGGWADDAAALIVAFPRT